MKQCEGSVKDCPTTMTASADNLIWIDLEMTGLDSDHDYIIEIATIVTTKTLDVLAEGPCIAIRQPLSVLEAMDEWNTRHHTSSGLWDRVLNSDVDHLQAQAQTLEFLEQFVPAGASPMCGNSICQDRRFLHRLMPDLERYFHYRHIDVSTIKELCRRWAPEISRGFSKNSEHLALQDIRDSIDELVYYRQFMGEIGGYDNARQP